jgi:hypothetical protein
MSDSPATSTTEFWSATALAAGAVGVIVVSILYGLSPVEAVLPMPDPVMPAALDGAVTGARLMGAASFVGIVADVIVGIGAIGLLLTRRSDTAERLGWAALAIAGIVFCVVDAMVGRVLPQVAVIAGGEPAFVAVKRLFDVLFVLGTFTFGCSLLGVFAAARREGLRFLAWPGLVVGAVAVAASIAHLAGLNAARPTGFAVLIGSALVAILAVRIARRSGRLTLRRLAAA